MTESQKVFNKQVVNAEAIGSEQSARWLIKGLTATYGVHNLTASVEQTADDIRSGRLRPFFAIVDGEPTSCAALIMGNKTVEVGRVTNMPGGRGGGELMRHVIKTWEDDKLELRPLVAEVRMAAPFEGIAGGQGSQASLLPQHKVGMIPHAFLPTFHHPGPNGPERQELFCFSTKQKTNVPVEAPDEISLPGLVGMNTHLIKSLCRINSIQSAIRDVLPVHRLKIRLKQVASIPFNVFIFDNEGQLVEEIRPNHNEDSPFDLVVANGFDPHLAEHATNLVMNGFWGAGISAPHEGPLKILFGRLGRCTFAPTEPMRNFPLVVPEDILQIDRQFRNQSQ